jgi:exosortase E/protease (VPEID-CTERM system)
VARWAAVALTLIVEYLVTSLRFDAHGVISRGGAWEVLAYAGRIGPLVVCLSASAVLFFSRRNAAPAVERRQPSGVLLGLHVLAFAGFWWTTTQLFGRPEAPSLPALWVVSWTVLACAVPGLLIAGVIRPESLGTFKSSGLLGFLALVGVAAWVAGTLTLGLWEEFSRTTLVLVARLLELITSGVVAAPEQLELRLDDFSIRVAAICSGYEGLGLMGVLLAGYVWTFRSHLRFPRVLWLFPIGLVLIWLSNVVRIAALMLVGAYVDADLAYGAFHSKAGWVLFCGIALSVIALGHRARIFARDPEASIEDLENPSAAYLMPMIALLATALVTSMFAEEVDVAYGARLVAVFVALYQYRSHYRELAWPRSWTAPIVGAALAVLWIGSSYFTASDVPEARRGPPPAVDAWAPWAFSAWVALRVIGSVAIVPICEELAFRGYLWRRLIARDFDLVSFRRWTPLALVGSSLAFGFLHERWILASVCGVAYGLVQLTSGRLSEAVVAHATTNAVISLWSLWTGDWSVWN